ncbi:MAG: hypothetical protein QOE97_690 [Pseudonocardiales bacterium]|jgi:hypothetical protein|nr:hypothetical protein [Pseudonocardiales bacterium]
MRADRTTGKAAVPSALAELTDDQLAQLVAKAPLIHSGIGGSSVRASLGGEAVFVKRLPLTDLERRADNIGSTRNLYGLPPDFHYGIGSAGFSAWRELAAYRRMSDAAAVPLVVPELHHWRVLERPPPPRAEWNSAPAIGPWRASHAIGERLAALAGASAQLVLCSQLLPQDLHSWLEDQVAAGTIDACVERVDAQLRGGVAALRAEGIMHFDTHFKNVVTDGQQLYFADFGLACATWFELSADEQVFLDCNANHDETYVVTHLVNWLVTALAGTPSRPARLEYIERCARRGEASGLTGAVAELVHRYAPVAAILNRFYSAMLEGRRPGYPRAELADAWSGTGLSS